MNPFLNHVATNIKSLEAQLEAIQIDAQLLRKTLFETPIDQLNEDCVNTLAFQLSQRAQAFHESLQVPDYPTEDENGCHHNGDTITDSDGATRCIGCDTILSHPPGDVYID